MLTDVETLALDETDWLLLTETEVLALAETD